MLSTKIYRSIGNLLSPSGLKARLTILIYHRVLEKKDSIFTEEVTTARFEKQMLLLKHNFNVLSLSCAIERLKLGTLPARSICITFDDGYADNVTQALPILLQHKLSATFFIATAYLNGGRMFNDTVIEAIRNCSHSQIDLTPIGLGRHDISSPPAKVAAINKILHQVKYLHHREREYTVTQLSEMITDTPLANNLMMTSNQLKSLYKAGMEIGGHTAHHPIIANLEESIVRKEIMEGKEFLESIVGEKIRFFAYPNGKPGIDFLPNQTSIVQDLGFEAAVSTKPGSATKSSDIYQLPRFAPWRPGTKFYIPEIVANLRHNL